MNSTKVQRLKDWLEIPCENDRTKTKAFISEVLHVTNDPDKGRCIVAGEEVQASTNLIKIPKKFLLNYLNILKFLSPFNQNALAFLKKNITNFDVRVFDTPQDAITVLYSKLDFDRLLKLTSHQLLVLYICLEKKRGKNSFWQPLLDCFPNLGEYEGIPMTWNLRNSPPVSKKIYNLLPRSCILHSKKQIEQFYNDIHQISSVSGNLELGIKEEEYLWAWLAVNTRCLYYKLHSCLPIGKTKFKEESSITMVPFVDYINHKTMDSNAIAKEAKSGYEVDSIDGIQKDEHVWFSYGPHDDTFLQCEYGFSTSELNYMSSNDYSYKCFNPYNTVNISEIVKKLLSLPKKKNVVEWLKQVGYYDDYTLGIDDTRLLGGKINVSVHPSFRTRIVLASLIEAESGFTFNELQRSYVCPARLEKFYQGLTEGEYYLTTEKVLLKKILSKLETELKDRLTSVLSFKVDSSVESKITTCRKLLLDELFIITSY